MFLSSHIMSEVERLCDRVGIIKGGELVQVGTLDELRHLTRYAMTVATEKLPEGLDKLPGVHNVRMERHGLCFHVDADMMGPVVDYINRFGIIRLESNPPSLEELFMQHYKSAENSSHAGESADEK